MTSYVLITPARNEEAYIEKTIQSVIAQTVLPRKWVIVSDGSTDGTDDIAKHYESQYDFIELLHRESDTGRDFASKVYAIRAGVRCLRDCAYDFIGMLDADVSFESDYYEKILSIYRENPKLGIIGGMLFDACGGTWIPHYVSLQWSVGGPVQMFRRKCYEDIGGYLPLREGGEDAVAEVMARMQGWEVTTFPQIRVLHHRRTGTEKGHILSARFRQGVSSYSRGGHPLFEIAKCTWRIGEKPYLLGSVFRSGGYLWAALRRRERNVPEDVVKYLHREQKKRLSSVLLKRQSKPLPSKARM
jgi:biofilm PGA synthesis N-glycosyltransferase PgaC